MTSQLLEQGMHVGRSFRALALRGDRVWMLRFVGSAGGPQVVHQDTQLASHGDRGALLGALASTFADSHSCGAQVTFGTEGSKNVLRTLDQEATKQPVASLGDVKLGIRASTLSAAWDQTHESSDRPARGEASWVLQYQDIGQRGDGTHAGNLLKMQGFRIPLSNQTLDLPVIAADLRVQEIELIQERRQPWTE